MTETGHTIADDGSSNYQFRLFRALKGSIWLAALGFLWLLDAFHVLRFSYTWPALIILAGVMMIVSRIIYSSAAAAAYYAEPPYTPGAPSQTVPPSEPGSTTNTTTGTDTHEGGN